RPPSNTHQRGSGLTPSNGARPCPSLGTRSRRHASHTPVSNNACSVSTTVVYVHSDGHRCSWKVNLICSQPVNQSARRFRRNVSARGRGGRGRPGVHANRGGAGVAAPVVTGMLFPTSPAQRIEE